MTNVTSILGKETVGNNYIVTKSSSGEGLLKEGYHIVVGPNGILGVSELHKFIISTDVILYEADAEVELI